MVDAIHELNEHLREDLVEQLGNEQDLFQEHLQHLAKGPLQHLAKDLVHEQMKDVGEQLGDDRDVVPEQLQDLAKVQAKHLVEHLPPDQLKDLVKDQVNEQLKEVLDELLTEHLGPVLTRLDQLVQQRTIKEWYTTGEVAEITGKAEYTVREYCRQSRVRAKKKPCGRGKGGEWLVSHEELTRLRNEGLLPPARAA